MSLDGIPIVDTTATGLLVLVFLSVLTDRLVWHTRLKEIKADRDSWKRIALDALGVADKMTTQGEVTTAIVASMPDPMAGERELP